MSSDTAKFEQIHKIDIAHHDYGFQAGDAFLALIKMIMRNPEARHDSLPALARYYDGALMRRKINPALEKTLHFPDRSLPITFASPILLAAGGNKTAESLSAFSSLGFGGIVVGSATRQAREGNPFRPRARLLPKDRAIQNSMGLNNPGVQVIASEVDRALGACRKRKLALGISVAETPGIEDEDEKIEDLAQTFRRAYNAADFIELNMSCPNTGEERLDARGGYLAAALHQIMEIRKNLAPRKAVFVKLSPDMGTKQLEYSLEVITSLGVTGVTLFNTFPADKARYLRMATPGDDILPVTADGRKGGISGRVLYKNTLPAVQFIKKQLPGLCVFASGGVDHGAKVLDLLEAGADAVQCYSVLAYRWNAVRKMNKELLAAMQSRGIKSLDELDASQ